jgi:hypothetical protein
MPRKFLLVLVVSFSLICVFMTTSAKAASPVDSFAKTAADCQKGSFLGLPTWYRNLTFDDSCNVELQEKIVNEDGTINESFDWGVLWGIGFAVIEMLLYIAGIVAVVFVIISGFMFVTNQGSPDKLVQARKTLSSALIGAVIAVISARVVGFIAGRWATAANGQASYGLINVDASRGGAIADILNVALTALGALSVLMMILTGIQFILSSANPEKVKKARNGFYYSLVGLVVAIFASELVNFVIDKLT